MGVHCCCLHENYIVNNHFDRSLHVGSSDTTCVQNFRPLPLKVFEIASGIQTEEQERQEELKKWTFCHISHVSGPILTNFYVLIHIDLSYHPFVSKVDFH